MSPVVSVTPRRRSAGVLLVAETPSLVAWVCLCADPQVPEAFAVVMREDFCLFQTKFLRVHAN